MDETLQDVRLAARAMLRDKGLSATALLSLALGIGGTTALFSALYGVLRRPLPYPDEDRLVRVYHENPGGRSMGRAHLPSSVALEAWSGRRTIEGLAGYRSTTFRETPGTTGGNRAPPRRVVSAFATRAVWPLWKSCGNSSRGESREVSRKSRTPRVYFQPAREGPGMKLVTEELEGSVVKVSLLGRMDIAGVEGIAVPFASLAATDNRKVIVDLAGVDFIASIGVRAILQNARAHKMRGGAMVLMAPQPLVSEVLQAAGVTNVVPVAPDLAAARAALAS
jgi:anti-anti-sigma factor